MLGAAETHVWAFEAVSPATADAGKRSILAGYTHLPLESLHYNRAKSGKPELATTGACSGLRINFSASAGLVLVALRRDHDVGVDVEAHRDLPAGIPQRAMTAAERKDFDALPGSGQGPRFFALWVAKEAAAKSVGFGLRLPFDSFDAADVVRLPREGGQKSVWLKAIPAPRPGFSAAIASTSPLRELRLWSLLEPSHR